MVHLHVFYLYCRTFNTNNIWVRLAAVQEQLESLGDIGAEVIVNKKVPSRLVPFHRTLFRRSQVTLAR